MSNHVVFLSTFAAVDRLSSLIMSSGCEGSSKLEAPRPPPEERNHMDKTSVVAQESPSSETNAKQALAIHNNSMPVTNIDDVIAELNSSESQEKDQNVLGYTDTIATEESSKIDDGEIAAPSQPNLLDLSALDVGNNACHFPVGKTFLNSYSRNFSNLGEDVAPLEKDHGEKPSMYSLVEDSDSESDSADSTVKTEMSQGHCEGPQDTDSDEEEVELCISTVSQPAFSQSEGSTLQERNSIDSSHTVDKTFASMDHHNSPSPSAQDKDSQENNHSLLKSPDTLCPQVLDDVLLNGNSGHAPTQQEAMCASQRILSNCNTDEKCETILKPVQICQTPGVTCSPVTQRNCHVTPRSQERTAKLLSDASQFSEKLNNGQVPLRSTVSEPKASNYTSGKTIEQVSPTLAPKDKERETVHPILDLKSSLSQNQSKSTTCCVRSLGTKTPNDTPVSPLLRSRLKVDDKKSNTSSKLKGLSIKSKSKDQEQAVTRSPRAESPVQKKALSSPSQSPKLHSKRTTPTGSPKLTRPSEKIRVSSCKTDKSQPTVSSILKANPINTTKEELKPSKKEQVLDLKEQVLKSEVTVVSTQRTFIEVRLSSSSSSTPVLMRKEVVNASHLSLASVPVDQVDWEASNSDPSLGSHTIPLESTNTSSSCPQHSGANKANETAEKMHCNGQEQSLFRNSNNKDAASSLKSNKSKLYLRGLERRSCSTDTSGSLDPNPFSVRQRIQSFENLASFDRSVVRCIDIPFYAINSKSPLNRRFSGYAGSVSSQSSDSRSLRRSFSSCVDSLSSTPSLPYPQNLSSSSTNSESTPLNQTPEAVMKEKVRNKSSQNQATVNTPPVLRSRNARAHGGLSRSKLREIRALSMPELDKLCSEDFTSDPGNVIFKTELEIHPCRSIDTAPHSLQCTMITRVSSVDTGALGSTSNGEQHEGQVTGLSCWSIR